jgi:hypothetical protein
MKYQSTTPISSGWVATRRYGLRPAPGGLALVEDFLNTRASSGGEADLLGDVDSARAWGTQALQLWSAIWNVECGPLHLTTGDVAKLRDLRAALQTVLAGTPLERCLPSASARFTMTSDGRAALMCPESGWRGLWALIMSEIMLSQQADVWQRLKLGRDPYGEAAYYDRRWNSRC